MTSAYDAIVAEAARRHGVPPETIKRFIEIESAGKPNLRTGSYKGLLQLSDREFRRHGGTGSIYDPAANINAGAAKLSAESKTFEQKYGRQPTAGELYMIHQQGWGGYQQHAANPDRPAWQSMYATGEGRSRGPGWARRAISGNMPKAWKAEVGPDNITSGEFMRRWTARVDRAPTQPMMPVRQDIQVALASPPPLDDIGPDPLKPSAAPPPPPPPPSPPIVASVTPPPAPPEPMPPMPEISAPSPSEAAPNMQALVAAIRAFGGDRKPIPFTPLPTSFRQYDSLMRA